MRSEPDRSVCVIRKHSVYFRSFVTPKKQKQKLEKCFASTELVTGRVWRGTAFGGWKSRTDVPKLVDAYMAGNLPVDHYITHRFQGVEQINDAIHALHGGDCLRAVITL